MDTAIELLCDIENYTVLVAEGETSGRVAGGGSTDDIYAETRLS